MHTICTWRCWTLSLLQFVRKITQIVYFLMMSCCLNWIGSTTQQIKSVVNSMFFQPPQSNQSTTTMMRLMFLLSYEIIKIFWWDCSTSKVRWHLTPDATPYAQLKARNIPLPYLEQQQLSEMEQLQIISAFEEPGPWCHPIVIAPKKDTVEIRICIDFTRLNQFTHCEYHPSDSPSEPVTSVPQEELAFVCKFGARHGY